MMAEGGAEGMRGKDRGDWKGYAELEKEEN